MAAVTELAGGRGHARGLSALSAPRASYYRVDVQPAPLAAIAATLTGTGPESGGTRNGLGSSSRSTVPGSLPSRCLCDVARRRALSTARFAPCIACSLSAANLASAGISCFIRRTRNRNCWPRRPISSGAGTSVCRRKQHRR